MRQRLTSKERRRQIINAATRLFARHGYKKITMKILAETCGVSEPALYRYFASKKDLYSAVLLALKDRIDIDQTMAELQKKNNIDELLFGLADFIVKTYSKNPELSRLLLFSALEGHPLARKTFEDLRARYVTFLAGKLQKLIRAGEIRRVHPVITARCFIGMVMDCSLGMHLWKKLQTRTYDPDQTIKNNVPIYIAGLKISPQEET